MLDNHDKQYKTACKWLDVMMFPTRQYLLNAKINLISCFDLYIIFNGTINELKGLVTQWYKLITTKGLCAAV